MISRFKYVHNYFQLTNNSLADANLGFRSPYQVGGSFASLRFSLSRNTSLSNDFLDGAIGSDEKDDVPLSPTTARNSLITHGGGS